MNSNYGKPRKLSLFLAVFLITASSLLGFFTTVSAAESVSASILEDQITDKKQMEVNDDGSKAWELVLEVTVQTDTPGIYDLFGDMYPSNINSQTLTSQFLKAGTNSIELSFSGSEIYNSREDGYYTILLVLSNDDGDLHTETYTTTGYYDHNDFEPDAKTDVNSIQITANTVTLSTAALTTIIYEKTPVVEYYYTQDNGENAKFKVTFTTLMGYADKNSNGEYDSGDEVIYSADLLGAIWDSKKALIQNFESFDFEITSGVTMVSAQNPNVDTEMRFHYSSANYETNTQRKFDIDIRLGGPLEGVDAIAVKHMITDESAGQAHTMDFDKHNDIIKFNNAEGKEHGYYSWLAKADSNNGLADIDVSASTETGADGLSLYLSYDYDTSVSTIFHDPEIGISPDNIGEIAEKIGEALKHHPGIYLVSSFIAAGIVMLTLFRRRK